MCPHGGTWQLFFFAGGSMLLPTLPLCAFSQHTKGHVYMDAKSLGSECSVILLPIKKNMKTDSWFKW